jgi:hypothetical protein
LPTDSRLLTPDARFLAFLNHGIQVLSFHALHQVLVSGDLPSHQRPLRLFPLGDRLAEQFARLLRQLGQDGREIHDDLPEQAECDGAYVLQLARFGRVLGQLPRLLGIDVRIGPVGQFHHQPHRPVVVARFIGLGDFLACGGALGKQAAVGRIRLGKTGEPRLGRSLALPYKLRCSAGQVDDFADEVRIDLVDELFGIQIQVVQPRAELAGVVVSQPGGVEVPQIRFAFDERPVALAHLLAVERQEAVHVHVRWQAESCGLEHPGPKQRVKVLDVGADEVMNLGGR